MVHSSHIRRLKQSISTGSLIGLLTLGACASTTSGICTTGASLSGIPYPAGDNAQDWLNRYSSVSNKLSAFEKKNYRGQTAKEILKGLQTAKSIVEEETVSHLYRMGKPAISPCLSLFAEGGSNSNIAIRILEKIGDAAVMPVLMAMPEGFAPDSKYAFIFERRDSSPGDQLAQIVLDNAPDHRARQEKAYERALQGLVFYVDHKSKFEAHPLPLLQPGGINSRFKAPLLNKLAVEKDLNHRVQLIEVQKYFAPDDASINAAIANLPPAKVGESLCLAAISLLDAYIPALSDAQKTRVDNVIAKALNPNSPQTVLLSAATAAGKFKGKIQKPLIDALSLIANNFSLSVRTAALHSLDQLSATDPSAATYFQSRSTNGATGTLVPIYVQTSVKSQLTAMHANPDSADQIIVAIGQSQANPANYLASVALGGGPLAKDAIRVLAENAEHVQKEPQNFPMESVGCIESRYFPLLAAKAKTEADSTVRQRLVAALLYFNSPDDQAIGILGDILRTDKDEKVREIAAKVLGRQIGVLSPDHTAAVISIIAESLEVEQDPMVIFTCIGALYDLPNKPSHQLITVLRKLSYSTENNRSKYDSLDALARFATQDNECMPDLLRAISSQRNSTVRRALMECRMIGPRAAVCAPRLREIIATNYLNCGFEADETLKAVTPH